MDLDASVPIDIVVSRFSGLTTMAFVFTLYVWSPLTKSIRWLCNVGSPFADWSKSIVSVSIFCTSGITLLSLTWKFYCKGRTSCKLTLPKSAGTPGNPLAYVIGTVKLCDDCAPLPLKTHPKIGTFALLA